MYIYGEGFTIEYVVGYPHGGYPSIYLNEQARSLNFKNTNYSIDLVYRGIFLMDKDEGN